MKQPPKGPLDRVLVLDLSRVLAGPWATQILADLGAEVIKIERPGEGDDTRGWGPPFAKALDGGQGDAAYYFCANRNKRSVALDFSRPEGAALVRRLAEKADVVVENFKTGGLDRHGLGYAELSTLNPRLVYCSITGFGHTGPHANSAGYDYMIQAMGGLMSITGQPDGTPGGAPMKAGVAVADLFTGLYASSAILAALMHARETGEGQHIDMALFDVQAAMLANIASNYLVSGEVPTRLGNAHPSIVPYQPLSTADGAVVVAVGNEHQFKAFCAALGDPALAEDPRFATNALRVGNRKALIPLLTGHTMERTSADWLARLDAAGVPCGPINTIDKVFAEPQAIARGLLVEQARADLANPVRTVASPLRLSKTPVSYRSPPPALGADTETVLAARLGLSGEEFADLRAKGVL